MSSFITTISFLILTLLPFSTAFLVDLDGDQLRNGKSYYIVVSSSGAGLTYTQKNKECPLYITSEFNQTSLGSPIQINTRLSKHYISLDDHVTLRFVDPRGTKPPCEGSLIWKPTLMGHLPSVKSYITTGGHQMLEENPFAITKSDKTLLPTFELQHCGHKGYCDFIGVFEDGLLGLTKYPTTFSFKKAFSVLEMSTS